MCRVLIYKVFTVNLNGRNLYVQQISIHISKFLKITIKSTLFDMMFSAKVAVEAKISVLKHQINFLENNYIYTDMKSKTEEMRIQIKKLECEQECEKTRRHITQNLVFFRTTNFPKKYIPLKNLGFFCRFLLTRYSI